MALTCGEETAGAFNGAEWLTKNQRELIDAQFALNEGAWGELDAQGHRVLMQIQAGEKNALNYHFEVTNRGGHSSRPVKDNAIYHLAAALTQVAELRLSGAVHRRQPRLLHRAWRSSRPPRATTEIAAAMTALVRDPNDAAAIALVSAKDPSWNGMLRTTCVATMLDAGHATNALPQRARANVNCRIFPGVTPETVRQKLEEIAADPAVKVTIAARRMGRLPRRRR